MRWARPICLSTKYTRRLCARPGLRRAHNPAAATSEFQKLLDHRPLVLNFVTAALVHLEIGRAYRMAGDTAKAKAADQDFLTLWKNADPDLPMLKQAQVEYAKLP
jgi:eukaryotic-like serine/threonine-protein kinase